MIHKVFTVYDTKAQAHLQPFFSQNKATAIRAIQSAFRDPQHQFTLYPQDYILFDLGSFDDATGEFDTSPPVSQGVLIEFQDVV